MPTTTLAAALAAAAVAAVAVPRGIRNHNPGNIRRTPNPRWQGLAEHQSDPEFLRFRSPEWGIRAMAVTLITYFDRHGLDTVREIIGRWAPPNENNTGAYVDAVARRVGVGSDETINVHDWSVMHPLVQAIILVENGQQPYTAAQIQEGLRMAGVVNPASEDPLPPGATVLAVADPKPLTRSRTLAGAATAALGAVTTVATSLASAPGATGEAARAAAAVADHLAPAATALDQVIAIGPTAGGIAALLGAGLAAWARIDDWATQRRLADQLRRQAS